MVLQRDAYHETRQTQNESVADLKKKFDDILLVFDAVGQNRPPQDELAVDFIRKLENLLGSERSWITPRPSTELTITQRRLSLHMKWQ